MWSSNTGIDLGHVQHELIFAKHIAAVNGGDPLIFLGGGYLLTGDNDICIAFMTITRFATSKIW